MKNRIYFFIIGAFVTSLSINSPVKAQTPNIVLGRPTDTSITASVMFDESCQFYIEYGTSTGLYSNRTVVYDHVAGNPNETDLRNLSRNTKYYYRLRYRKPNTRTYLASPEYVFQTQRIPGSTFTFTIETDEHIYDKKGVQNLYEIALANQAADNPDFMLSLGDIFGDDRVPNKLTNEIFDSLHKQYRPLLGKITHSIPFYVCLGNHEGENDYYYSLNQPDNLCIWGTKWRKYYYPNPFPNSFYTGNADVEPFGLGNPENYFSWTWGDALFVVLDAYRHENVSTWKPDGWDWSLSLSQYNWLKTTLETSNAKYKFVFTHHLSGQLRGGVINARFCEWGGNDPGTTNYTFPQYRPLFSKPVHQLLVDNHVNIFFQGHDHVFSHESLDGLTYQSCPMTADSTYEIGYLANADAYLSNIYQGSGHLRVTVSPTTTKVDFVRAYLPKDTTGGKMKNGEVAYSYNIYPAGSTLPYVHITASKTKVCPRSSVLFSSLITNISGNPQYKWKKNGVILRNNSSSYIDSTLSNGDIITCSVTSSGVTYNSNQIIMSVDPAIPQAPTFVGGQTYNICNKNSTFSYSVTLVPSATNYIWTVTPGITIVSGQGTDNLVVKYATSFNNGTISVKASSGCGTSLPYSINVFAKPESAVSISGLTGICSNQSNVGYSVLTVPGATNYFWTSPVGSSIVAGQGTNFISVNFGTRSGIISVTPSNGCGNADITNLNVRITCKTSDPFFDRKDIISYQNPFIDRIRLYVSKNLSNANVTLLDLSGRMICKWEKINFQSNNLTELNISSKLPKGIYMLRIENAVYTRSFAVYNQD